MTDEDASAGETRPDEPASGDGATTDDPVADDDEAATGDAEQVAGDDGTATGDDGTAGGDAETAASEEAADDEAEEASLGPTGTALVAKVAIEDEGLADDVEDHLLELAAERQAAEERADDAEERADDLASKLKRKQADFENYKKRAKRRQEDIRERATADLVERLLEVRDDLVRAVEDDHDDVTSLREGVKLTLEEFDRVLDAEDVTEIAPQPGDEVDPQRHEVMLRVESDQPEERVADVHRSGFEMAGTVLRPAQVTVSEGPDDGDDADDDGDDADGSAGGTGDEADEGTPDGGGEGGE